MVLLEALALARPVVATRVGGIPEVIEDRVTGWLIGAGREGELAEACMVLMDEFHLVSEENNGTKVTIKKWKR